MACFYSETRCINTWKDSDLRIHELSFSATLWPNSEQQVIVHWANMLLWAVWLRTGWPLQTHRTRTAKWRTTTTSRRRLNPAIGPSTLGSISRSLHLAVGTKTEWWSTDWTGIEAYVKQKHSGLANDVHQLVGTVSTTANVSHKRHLGRWNSLAGILRSRRDCCRQGGMCNLQPIYQCFIRYRYCIYSQLSILLLLFANYFHNTSYTINNK